MDRLDAAILQMLQDGFPVLRRPYEVIGTRCGCSEEEAERRTRRMLNEGVIRRLGAVVDSRALGMVTTLVAADVRDEAVDDAAADIDRFPEVTHSYLREGRPNLWFTLVASSQAAVDAMLRHVRSLPGVLCAEEHPATRVYKLAVKVGANATE
jgi:DNA-binding Lrp family transcriptional regulator